MAREVQGCHIVERNPDASRTSPPSDAASMMTLRGRTARTPVFNGDSRDVDNVPQLTTRREKGRPLERRDLWDIVRSKAHIIFPCLGGLAVVLILTSPLFPAPLQFLSDNAFARFCMFWCFAVFAVLSFANKYMRPQAVALFVTVGAIIVAAGFCAIYSAIRGGIDMSPFLFSCLSGAILGALAGTWLIYVLEVYSQRR